MRNLKRFLKQLSRRLETIFGGAPSLDPDVPSGDKETKSSEPVEPEPHLTSDQNQPAVFDSRSETTALKARHTQELFGSESLAYLCMGRKEGDKEAIFNVLRTRFSFAQFTDRIEDLDDRHAVVLLIAESHSDFARIAESLMMRRGDITILHPAALFCHMPMARRPKFSTLGFPGCGNALVGVLSEALLGHQSPAQVDDVEPCETLFWRSAQQHHQFVEQAVVSIFDPQDIDRYWTIDEVYPYILVHLQFKDGRELQLSGIVSPRRWVETRSGSHSFVSPLMVKEAKLQNRTIIRIERHPLDCLLSLSNKVNASEGQAIEDARFLRNASASIVEYYRSWDCLGGNFERLRYEDFANDGPGGIVKLSRFLDVELRPGMADQLWDEYGFKPLPTVDTSHFRGGGSDKWRHRIGPHHYGLLQRTGIHQLCVDLGYGAPWELVSDQLEPELEELMNVRRANNPFALIEGRQDIGIHGDGCVTLRGTMCDLSERLQQAISQLGLKALLKSGAVLGTADIDMRPIGFEPLDFR